MAASQIYISFCQHRWDALILNDIVENSRLFLINFNPNSRRGLEKFKSKNPNPRLRIELRHTSPFQILKNSCRLQTFLICFFSRITVRGYWARVDIRHRQSIMVWRMCSRLEINKDVLRFWLLLGVPDTDDVK